MRGEGQGGGGVSLQVHEQQFGVSPVTKQKKLRDYKFLGKPANAWSQRTELWRYIKGLESEFKSRHQMHSVTKRS